MNTGIRKSFSARLFLAGIVSARNLVTVASKAAVYLLLALCLTVLSDAQSTAQTPPGIVFVDSQGSDGNSGSSWAKPKQTLAGAVAIAGPGTQIWVKQGLYPTANVNIGPGIYLYGGFAGNETILTQRNVRQHASIIDGSNGGSYNTPIYFVSDYGIPAGLDGFTIQHTANAISITWDASSSASPVIADNTIIDSGHTDGGVGCAIVGLHCTPTIVNNTFSTNIGGCLCFGNGAYPIILDNVFDSNSNVTAGSGGYDGIFKLFSAYGGMIQGNTFTNNVCGGYASTIDGDSGALTMIGNTFVGNTAESASLTWSDGNIDVEGNVFSNNTSGNSAGALNPNSCTGTVTGNIILNNTGTVGGMESVNNSLTISHNLISGNSGSWNSGFVEYASSNDIFINNVLSNNPGTAVDWENSAGAIGNCLISGSTTGISLYNATPLVANNTIVQNTGTGLALNTAAATLRNNIIAFNNVGLYAYNVLPDADYDCVYGNSGGNYTGNFIPSAHDVSADPLLDASFKPTANSPCINAGDNAAIPPAWIPRLQDLTGGARIIGGIVDIGAYEFGAVTSPQLTFLPSTVTGGFSATGRLKLVGPAPAGGLTITLSSRSAVATVPATLSVPAGAQYAYFQITTVGVAVNTSATITASCLGRSLTATLSVVPPTVASVHLLPNFVVGGQANSMGIVTLTGPVGSAPLTVSLTSNSPSIANPTVAHITIPVGSAAGTFTIQTNGVASNQTATISASVAGVTQSAPLTVSAPVPVTASWMGSTWIGLPGFEFILEWDLIITVNVTNTGNDPIPNLNIDSATYSTGYEGPNAWAAVLPVPGVTYYPGQAEPVVSLGNPELVGPLMPGQSAQVLLKFQYLVPGPFGVIPVPSGEFFPLSISVDYPYADAPLPTISVPTP